MKYEVQIQGRDGRSGKDPGRRIETADMAKVLEVLVDNARQFDGPRRITIEVYP